MTQTALEPETAPEGGLESFDALAQAPAAGGGHRLRPIHLAGLGLGVGLLAAIGAWYAFGTGTAEDAAQTASDAQASAPANPGAASSVTSSSSSAVSMATTATPTGATSAARNPFEGGNAGGGAAAATTVAGGGVLTTTGTASSAAMPAANAPAAGGMATYEMGQPVAPAAAPAPAPAPKTVSTTTTITKRVTTNPVYVSVQDITPKNVATLWVNSRKATTGVGGQVYGVHYLKASTLKGLQCVTLKIVGASDSTAKTVCEGRGVRLQ